MDARLRCGSKRSTTTALSKWSAEVNFQVGSNHFIVVVTATYVVWLMPVTFTGISSSPSCFVQRRCRVHVGQRRLPPARPRHGRARKATPKGASVGGEESRLPGNRFSPLRRLHGSGYVTLSSDNLTHRFVVIPSPVLFTASVLVLNSFF